MWHDVDAVHARVINKTNFGASDTALSNSIFPGLQFAFA